MTLYQYQLHGLNGQDINLADYQDKVLLLVNTASACGFTPQYAELEQLHRQFADDGLVIIGFPCNDFGGQEPGSEQEIQTFCTSRYQVTFPMFAKVKIAGEGKHPLFAGLVGGQEVQWNFEKFLLGKDGKLIARYGSDAEPEGGDIEAAVKKALGL